MTSSWSTRLNRLVAWGTALLLFLLPWQTRWIAYQGRLNGGPWEYGSLSLLASELLLWAIVILWLGNGGWRKLRSIPLPAAAIGLLAWAVTSGWWASDSIAWQQSVRMLIDGIVLFALVTSGPLPWVTALVSFIVGAGLQAVLAWWQFIAQQIPASSWLGLALHRPDILGDAVVESATGRWLRPYGALPHPNILGGWLAVAWVGVLGLVDRAGQQRSQQWFVLSAWLLIGMGLMVSFSRSAWVAAVVLAVVVGGWLIVKHQWRRIHTIMLVSIILLGSIWLMTYAPLIIARVQAAGRIETLSLDTREQLWYWGVTIAQQHWLVGVGLGNATAAVYTTINSQLPSWQYQPPHSVYLTSLVELGVVGGLLVGWLVINIAWRARDTVITLAPWLVIVMIGLFDHYPWTLFAGSWLWWLTAALAIRAQKNNITYDR